MPVNDSNKHSRSDGINTSSHCTPSNHSIINYFHITQHPNVFKYGIKIALDLTPLPITSSVTFDPNFLIASLLYAHMLTDVAKPGQFLDSC